MANLFDLTDLAAFVQGDLDTATAEQCRSVATGIVLGLTHRTELPDPLPAPLVSVGKRMAARLNENPTSLTTETLAGYSANYSALLDEIDLMVLRNFDVRAIRGMAGSTRMRPECWQRRPFDAVRPLNY